MLEFGQDISFIARVIIEMILDVNLQDKLMSLPVPVLLPK